MKEILINDTIKDISTESLVIGSFYKDPTLLLEYDELIYPEWDFTNEDLRFLFNLIRHCYLMNINNINEIVIKIETEKNDDWKKQYKKIDGYKTIVRLIDKANIEDFPQYYRELKRYNLLRELERKNFPIRDKLEKFKKGDPEDIYKYFDFNLADTFKHYQGIQDSIILGKNMREKLRLWKEEPDVGTQIPYFITNNLIRGWRLNCLNGTGMHSGFGKSRWVSRIAFDMALKQSVPVLILVNEDDEEVWNAIYLTSVVNNYFVFDKKNYINETKIVTGNLTKEEFAICDKAAEWIEKNSKVYFQETQIYDYDTLRRILKVHKLKGVSHFIYDTFKPFRDTKGSTWEAFVQTSEMLKQLCGSKRKGGLDLAGWITFQLTDNSQFDRILNSTSVASAKNIKHNLNFMSMYRVLSYAEKQSMKVKIALPDHPFYQEILPLDLDKEYYIGFVDKNKQGKDKVKIIMEVQKGEVVFNEIGYAIFPSKEDEDLIQDRNKYKK